MHKPKKKKKKSEKFWPRLTKQLNQVVLQTNKKHVGGSSIPDIVEAFGNRQTMKQEQVINCRLDCAEEIVQDRQTTDNTHTHTHSHTQWVSNTKNIWCSFSSSHVSEWSAVQRLGVVSRGSVPLLDLQPHGSSCRAQPHQRSDPQTRSTHEAGRTTPAKSPSSIPYGFLSSGCLPA